jgi:hypothetical protein
MPDSITAEQRDALLRDTPARGRGIRSQLTQMLLDGEIVKVSTDEFSPKSDAPKVYTAAYRHNRQAHVRRVEDGYVVWMDEKGDE